MARTEKNEFFEKFGKKILKTSSPSILKTLKPFLWVAWVIGVFPVQVSCIWWQGVTLHIKKISLAYFYSFCLFCYKITIMIQFWDFMIRAEPEENKEILTDFIAGILGFFFGFCFGNFAHILAIWKLPSFLNSINSIEAFDKKYAIGDGDCPYVDKPVKGGIIIKMIVACFVVIYTPLTMIWHIISAENASKFQVLPGIYMENCYFIIGYMALGFLAMEFGTGFLYMQLFSVKNLLTDRLTGIIKMVQEKNKTIECPKSTDSDSLPKEDWSVVTPPNPFSHKSWQAIACQYADFLEIFAKYQQFSGPYFTTLYSTLIIASVCIIYPQINHDKSLALTFGPALKLATLFTLLRIIGLANAGETFKITFKKLVKALMISSVQPENDELSTREMEYFKGFLKEVTTSKLVLSANGFFTVSFKNVTSIVSVIITYTIVLLQFSSADKKKDYNSGISGNYGMGAPGNYSDLGYDSPFLYNQSLSLLV